MEMTGTFTEEAKKAPPFEHILFPRSSIHRHAELLARFLASVRYDDIPSDVLQMTKLITLDTLGCVIAGTSTPLGEKIVSAYGTGNQPGGCCVPGTSLRLSPSMAAKLNGWLSDVLDYEDVVVGHPSATVIPAAFAMAEYIDATPQQFLAAVVAGYEAGLRVHDATRPSPEAYQKLAVYHAWHGVAAGAAAMVVSGGSEEQFRSALGHAAANTNLPLWYVQYGRPAHALKANPGQMALAGVDAAICARRDIIGPFAMLSDAERGFATIIGSDQFDPTQFSAGLGQVWRTRESCLKAFPCCAALHTTIDAVSSLVNVHHIDHNEVDQLQIRCCSRIAEWFSDSAPSSEIDAQLSVQYVSIMALLSIEVGKGWYSPEIMASHSVFKLMRKVEVEVDPAAEEAFWSRGQFISSVTILLRGGERFTTSVGWPPGNWRRPFNVPDVQKKFLRNLRGTSLEEHGDKIVEMTLNMDQFSSLNELSRLLSTART